LANKYSPYPGDTIPAILEDGEYVLNRNAVKAIGKDKLDRINHVEEPRFAQNGGFMENAGFPTQNKFKLGLARKMANGGIATRDAQQRRNYINYMQGPKELQGPPQNPNDRYISDREAELRGFGEDPYYEADYISDEQASKMGFDIPENVQGPVEKLMLQNLNLDNYVDEFGMTGGNLNLPRPSDSFEIRKSDNQMYPSRVEPDTINIPKSMAKALVKKYLAPNIEKTLENVEPFIESVTEGSLDAGEKLLKGSGEKSLKASSDIIKQVREGRKGTSRFLGNLGKAFKKGRDSTKSNSKTVKTSKSNTNSTKESDKIKEKVTKKNNKEQPFIGPMPKEDSPISDARLTSYGMQEGGDVMDRSTAKSIGVPNVDKRMQRRLQQIRLQMQQQKLLKHRSGGDIGLYNRHVKAREESGDFLTKKQIDDTFKYFIKRQSGDIPRMQQGGMVNSTGDNMSGVQMNSRRLLNMAKRRKNVRG